MFEPRDFHPGDQGHKIIDELEHPFTTHLYLQASDMLLDGMHAMGLTPNHLTTIRLATGLLSVYWVTQRKPIWAAAMFLISYAFDCFDGAMARKHDQITEWGSAYDHYADGIVTVLIFVAIMKYYPMNRYWLLLLSIAVFGTLIHMGNVELFNNECLNLAPCLDTTIQWCKMFTNKFYINRHHATKSEFCHDISHQMKGSRYLTDVCIVLVLSGYLFTCNRVECKHT